MRIIGNYQQLGTVRYFVPDVLPPKNPLLDMTPEIIVLYGQAQLYLGRLNEIAGRLPNPDRFVTAYVMKEALLSSAIEGIHTTLLDVFTHNLEETSKITKETQLVLNYVKAMHAAVTMLHDQVPITSKMLLAAHERLMSTGEGEKSNPGQYRKQSVKVGDFIPPLAPEILPLMADLERYINEDTSLPPLIKAGLAHVQFEMIHPFLDGNGRIGRLLIVLMLVDAQLLTVPVLYPSYYFKKHALEYYQRLNQVHEKGDFEGWILFYLRVVATSSADAYKRAVAIEQLGNDLRKIISEHEVFAQTRKTGLLVLELLFSCPVITISKASVLLNKSYNTVSVIFGQLVSQGLLVVDGNKKRGRRYRFEPYFKVLEQEFFEQEF
jgi:Fic family protein